MENSNGTAGFAPIHRGRLYYEMLGEGDPLVLIHAGIADLRMWDDQFPVFAEHFRTIRYDQRGYGKSESEPGTFSPRRDLCDLLDYLGADRASFIGVSIGGQLVVDFALEYPDRVMALVPVAAALSGFEPSIGDDEKSRFEQVQFARANKLMEQQDFEQLIELGLEIWLDGPMQSRDRVSPQVRARAREMCWGVGMHMAEGSHAEPLQPPAYGRLNEILAPTLVIVGNLDTTGILQQCDILGSEIPGARKVIVTDTAHLLNMEKPAEFNEIILDFLHGSLQANFGPITGGEPELD